MCGVHCSNSLAAPCDPDQYRAAVSCYTAPVQDGRGQEAGRGGGLPGAAGRARRHRSLGLLLRVSGVGGPGETPRPDQPGTLKSSS